MKRMPGRSAVAPLITVSIIIRIFWGLCISHSYVLNASWICPILGFILYYPLGFAINQASELNNGSAWSNLSERAPKPLMQGAALLFAVLLLHDGAITARLAADSTNIIALNEVTAQILVLPMGIVALLVIWMGVEACGNSSRIWLRFYTLLSIIIFFIQIRSCNIGWLTPILGSGINNIISGAIYCAGCMSLLSLVWIISQPDRCQHGVLRPPVLATLIVVVLLLIQQTLAPALPSPIFNRAERIELILGNGRLSLSPQIILDILWYGNLLHLLSSEATAASAFLQSAFPKLPVWLLGIACSVLLTIAAVTNFLNDQLTSYILPLAGAILALIMFFVLPEKKVQKNAKS